MSRPMTLAAVALLGVLAAAPPVPAQTTTLTMSSWVSPQHHVTLLLQGWATETEKVTDAAFVAEVRKRSAPIIEDWIKKAGAKGLDGAKILAEFHEELKKVAAGK